MGWFLNAEGKPDTTLTFATVTLVVVLFKVLLGGISFKVHGQNIHIDTLDASMVGALLTPTLGAYVARKYTDRKFDPLTGEALNARRIVKGPDGTGDRGPDRDGDLRGSKA